MAPLFLLILTHSGLAFKRNVIELFSVVLFWVIYGITIWLKYVVSEPRPAGTCLESCGMPSGHSSISIGFLIWYLAIDYGGKWKYAFLVLTLVPWSRWQLQDHSFAQCIFGSLLGTMLALGWVALFMGVRRHPTFRVFTKDFLRLRDDLPEGAPLMGEDAKMPKKRVVHE